MRGQQEIFGTATLTTTNSTLIVKKIINNGVISLGEGSEIRVLKDTGEACSFIAEAPLDINLKEINAEVIEEMNSNPFGNRNAEHYERLSGPRFFNNRDRQEDENAGPEQGFDNP